MKVAIPTFGKRVSQRFDYAPAFLIVTVQNGSSREREELSASGWAPHERIPRLLELGVDSIVCGGIDCWSAEILKSAGVAIHSQIVGEIDKVLARLLQGNLRSDAVTDAVTDAKASR